VNQGVEHTIDPPSLSSARRLPHGRRGPNASSPTIQGQGATSPPVREQSLFYFPFILFPCYHRI
jgi:hypothetical protein